MTSVLHLLRPGGLLLISHPSGAVPGLESHVDSRTREFASALSKAASDAGRSMQLVQAESMAVKLGANQLVGGVDIMMASV